MMIRKRHHLGLEDFQSVISCLEGATGSSLDDLLKPVELAELLHVSSMTVYTWVNKRDPDIPHIRIGGRRGVVRFPKHWFVEWAKKREEALKKWNFEL